MAWSRSFLWLLGFTPSVVCLKGFILIRGLFEGLYPHQWFVWKALRRQCFGSSPEMLPNEDYWAFVLRCRATSFLPCLVNLTIILSYKFHTCSFIHAYTACTQISFMHGCINSLILIVQKVSSITCLSQKCYQSCVFQVAGPTKTVVHQCLFISPVFSPVLVVTPLR